MAFEPRGEQGSGYYLVFYSTDLNKTIAELPLELKIRLAIGGRQLEKSIRC